MAQAVARDAPAARDGRGSRRRRGGGFIANDCIAHGAARQSAEWLTGGTASADSGACLGTAGN